ncbi:thermonuclease family protein [Cytobacillus suaedae]|nr:thermonuclease family protein [Cytobacillus suaedae]
MKKWTSILLAFALIFSNVFTLSLPANVQAETSQDLIISEYIEGSSNNKALEIYNGTGVDVELSQYSMVGFTNGANQAGTGYANELKLSGTLAAGDVYVIAHSSSNQAILDVADTTGSSFFYQFNGDDALVLFKNYDSTTRTGTVVDSIGKVGEDPGSAWGTDVQTVNTTLVRNPSIVSGDTDITNHYDPATEWIGFPTDTFDYLGAFNPNVVAPTPEEPKSEYTVTVKSVTDGDTIKFDPPIMGNDTVRYLNIDTPETYHQGSYDMNLVNSNPDHAQKYHGELAKQHLNSLLQPGEEIILKVGEEVTDAYGRILAQVIRKSDGINTNLEMVKQGFAVTYFIWPVGDEATYNEFQAAVKYASDNNLGIWSDNNTDSLELPFVFRAREQGKGLSRYVGNSYTQKYVQPQDWATVPVEKRVFFSEEEAIANGYTPAFERGTKIADARYASVGSNVTVEGVVTHINGKNYYIQDDTAGIVVRSSNLEANVGDQISANGVTSEFYNMLQVVTENVQVVEAGVGVPNPNFINATELGEKLEGTLVALENVTVESVDGNHNYSSKDSLGNSFVIDSDNDLVETGKSYDTIIGVVDYNFSEFKVMPRSTEDVIADIPVISIAEARATEIGTKVQVEGVVTAIEGKNYYVQDGTAGIVIRVEEAGFTAQVGDKIRGKARTEEYFGLLQIIPSLANVSIVETGVGTPDPKLITSADMAEVLEAQLVTIANVTVDLKDRFGEFTSTDAVGSFVIDNNDFVEVDRKYESITGVITYSYGKYKLVPRTEEDTVLAKEEVLLDTLLSGDVSKSEEVASGYINLVEEGTVSKKDIVQLIEKGLTEAANEDLSTMTLVNDVMERINSILERAEKDRNPKADSTVNKQAQRQFEQIIKKDIPKILNN